MKNKLHPLKQNPLKKQGTGFKSLLKSYLKSTKQTMLLASITMLSFQTGLNAQSNLTLGGVNMGNLLSYHMVFTNGKLDANWQSASKGYAGNVAVDGIEAKERTSGSFAYAGTITTNDVTLGAWQNIVNNNSTQASALTGQTATIAGLEANLENAFSQINLLTASAGLDNESATSLNGLNKQNGIAETIVINVTSGMQVSSKIYITGDANDIFILRWDNDANFNDGYEGQVKFQSGGAIVPLGGLTPANFIHVAGEIASSGGGSNPPAPYPQGPRLNNGTGALINGASNFSGGGFFTGYWLTTGAPTIFGSGQAHGPNGSLSNAIFVGGWYSKATKFSMTSGTSGVYVAPPTIVSAVGSIGNYVWLDLNSNGINDEGPGAGLNGVSVELWKETSPGSGVYVLESTTSTANDAQGNSGYYNFSISQSGNFKVKFPLNIFSDLLTTQNPASGVDQNSDANPVDGFSPVVSIDVNGTGLAKDNPTIDAGYFVPKAKVGDYVWNDINKDGIQDFNEPGMSGVTVTLIKSSTNQVMGTVTTDNNGFYLFNPVAPGTYKLMYSLPSGYLFTAQDQGTDDNADSDVDTTTGMTPSFTLVNNQFNTSVDAGMYFGLARMIQPVSTTDVILYPNPVQDQLYLDFASEKAGNYWVNLTDLSGKLIQRKQIHLESGRNTIEMATNEINDGLYLLNVLSEGFQKSFIVQVIH